MGAKVEQDLNGTLTNTETLPGGESTSTQGEGNEKVIENSSTPGESKQGEVITKEEPEWKPDFSYKVRDKKFEFDPDIQKVITKENHAKIKELYEKAGGLDFAKARMDKYDADFQALQPEVSRLHNIDNLHKRLDGMLEQGDFTSFQKTLNIPDAMVIQRAIEILKHQELPQEERARIERMTENQAKLYNLENENMQYQQQLQEQAVLVRHNELDQYLSKPDIASIVTDFDTRMGQEGAFKAEVIARGQLAYNLRQIDLSTEQAVKEVMMLIGANPGANAKVANLNTNSKISTTEDVDLEEGQQKPTLPNIRPGSKSPTGKKVFKSIDELREHAKNLGVTN